VFALCRQLVAGGNDDTPMAVLRRSDRTELFRLPSIHRAAKKTIVEGEHGETLADYREGPTARRTSERLDGAAVSFASLRECVLAPDAATSPLTPAHYGVGRNKLRAVLGIEAIRDQPGRSASGRNVPHTASEVL
jgi:hypothetical protein